jgi:hypothetical protein
MFWVIASLAAGSLAIAGCGDSSEADEITVKTGSLSKAEFVKRVDEICRVRKADTVREFRAFIEEKGLSQKAAPQDERVAAGELAKDIIAPNYEDLIDDISALGAPGGDEEEVAGFLNALQQNLEELEADPTSINDLGTPFKLATKRADKYGLKACVNSLS